MLVKGLNPHAMMRGKEGDIRNLFQFDWYEWVCYRFNDANSGFPQLSWTLVIGSGLDGGAGNEICQLLLKSNGKIFPRRTARPL